MRRKVLVENNKIKTHRKILNKAEERLFKGALSPKNRKRLLKTIKESKKALANLRS